MAVATGTECNGDVTTVIHMSCALLDHRGARCMMISPMRWTVLAALLLCAPCVLVAQSHHPQSAKTTYVSPEGTFRFDYPKSLVQCRRSPDQSNWWIPAESCESFIPICFSASGDSESTVACVAYPANDMKGTNFEGAAFSVSELKSSNTEHKCRSVGEDSRTAPITTQAINGVKFTVTETVGVATGHGENGLIYTNFHQGKCYELDITIASASAGYSDQPLKPFDFENVRGTLKMVLDSFKFLN